MLDLILLFIIVPSVLSQTTYTNSCINAVDHVRCSYTGWFHRPYDGADTPFDISKPHTVKKMNWRPQGFSISQGKNVILEMGPGTDIHMLDEYTLNPAFKYTELSFVDCKIRQVQNIKFDSVERLNLSSNAIKLMKDDVFEEMTELREIDLSRNGIGRIYNKSFVCRKNNMLKLEYLDLSYNALTTFTGVVNCKFLSVLLLNDNRIKTISTNTFAEFNKLSDLNLASNGLTTIQKYSFVYNGDLGNLDLRNNSLKDFDFDAEMKRSLAYVNLTMNPLDTAYAQQLFFSKQLLMTPEIIEDHEYNLPIFDERDFEPIKNCSYYKQYIFTLHLKRNLKAKFRRVKQYSELPVALFSNDENVEL